ncbi:MAG: ABC transporter permease [Planctomycetales bacterium]|nr:ABC transporter permease [Planctomycetales bacterium]
MSDHHHALPTKAGNRLWLSREFGLLLLIGLTTLIVCWVDPRFAAWENWRDIAVRAAPTVIVSCGVMLVVITGEIDISVGSLTAICAATMGMMLSVERLAWPLGVGAALTLLLGTGVGTLTGCLVTWGRVPSIIVTLGLLTGLRGVTTWVMGGENISHLPLILTDAAKRGWGGIPLSIYVAITVIVAQLLLLHRTPWGRRLYAVGSSAHAAEMAGLPIDRLKRFAFAYTGFLTAVATLVDVPRLPKIEAGIGAEFELLVVTCVVVGGVAVAGGRGSVCGVLLAVVLMTMVRPVLTFLDIGEAGEKWTKAIQGSFILMTVVADSLSRANRRAEGDSA